jgi:outer membrane protein OmpA-like peptidoglycan-associated protein
MKNLFFLVSFLALTSSAIGQMDQHYSVSGGLLGALNYNQFRIGGNNPEFIDYSYKLGWSAGAWFNLPLSSGVSIEPQVMYSVYDYESGSRSDLLNFGTINYLSVPILFKFHMDDGWAITLGPQFDFLGDLHDAPDDVVKDDFASTSIGISGGLELLPHAPVVIFARYVYGITDLLENESAYEAEYYNSNFQFGLKVKLFGNSTPIDRDNDGVTDKNDKCPDVAGLVQFDGCPDSDSDGIIDSNDNCPNQAGIAKYNGCPIPDTDNDGINDEVDKCPSQAGVAKYNGCPVPDKDNDGINDDNDKCPDQAGVAKYNGCPIPDTDGDGINDDNDKCPTQAGIAKYNGCPVPDRDKDGVADEMDRCPDYAGPADNEGCPRVENAVFSSKKIQFVTGSANLTAQAKKDIKEGAKLLNSTTFANLKVEIQGHTDNVGSSESNHKLSHDRAESVKAELVKDGVSASRLTTVGFGEDMPIADNGTAEGRAKNRRVELKVSQ